MMRPTKPVLTVGILLLLTIARLASSFVTMPLDATGFATSTGADQREPPKERPQLQQQRRSPRKQRQQRRKQLKLFGISEWRDLDFQLPGTANRPLGVESLTAGLPKPVCLLPFPYQEVLLQGEVKQLRLYEDRFKALFQDVCVCN